MRCSSQSSWRCSQYPKHVLDISDHLATVRTCYRGDVYGRVLVNGQEVFGEEFSPFGRLGFEVPLALLQGADRIAERVEQRHKPEPAAVDASDRGKHGTDVACGGCRSVEAQHP